MGRTSRKNIKGRTSSKLTARSGSNTALQEVYDAHAVVLEDINDNIQGLAEAFLSLDQRLSLLEQRTTRIEDNVQFIKEELRLIRYELKNKAGRSDLPALDRRITKLERRVFVIKK